MTPLLMIHFAVTWLMVGIIWTVQVVHYPLMAHTGPEHSARYQRLHVQRMSALVVPVMLVEAVTVLMICFQSPWVSIEWLGALLLAGIWGVTACISVPSHEVLSQRFDREVHRRLVASNGIRAALWSCRGLLAVQLVIS
jgi:hypothetical protein